MPTAIVQVADTSSLIELLAAAAPNPALPQWPATYRDFEPFSSNDGQDILGLLHEALDVIEDDAAPYRRVSLGDFDSRSSVVTETERHSKQ